ncbi:hypothetical protein EBL89_03635 [Cereibacter sphaeroides]|uniref:hypothetical protein n=1 Tax=Cereibacter sphaeroides TaxID=1063 RepID=UPI000F546C36|nr:hypothetical protein [Cereibacter sphaeroides]AZB54457.1 hypothetical protein EBL89_03635 [Cereibacter sphaeroides]AZB58731.1 hypothetical protein EBL88_03725 [Cereibacter sphaeroides]
MKRIYWRLMHQFHKARANRALAVRYRALQLAEKYFSRLRAAPRIDRPLDTRRHRAASALLLAAPYLRFLAIVVALSLAGNLLTRILFP